MLKLSASSIGCYDKCPKQYHYRYIEKPQVEEKDWSFLEFGKCGHETLEKFHIHLMNNACDPSEYKSIMRDSLKSAIKNYKMEILRPDFPELKDILQKYLNMVKSTGLPPVIEVEKNFSMMIDKFTVRGFIDRIDLIEPGYYHVVDYKTNKNPKYLTPFQLLLYALAIKEIYPDAKRIRGSYCLLKHKSTFKTWEFSESDIEKTKNKIIQVGTDITIGKEWEKRPTVLCNWCDYQSICQGSPKDLELSGDNWVSEEIFD